jgi:hypothetical protein
MEQTWEPGSAKPKTNFSAVVYLETGSEVCHDIFVNFYLILKLDGPFADDLFCFS